MVGFTTVTGTVRGPEDIYWTYCTVTATFSRDPSYGGTYVWQGSTFNTLSPITTVADSHGVFTLQVPDNLTMSPPNGRWIFTFVPNASAGTSTSAPVTVFGDTLDITDVASRTVQVIRVDALTMQCAYDDSQVQAQRGFGNLYYNTTSNTLRMYVNDAVGWYDVVTGPPGGGSGGGGGEVDITGMIIVNPSGDTTGVTDTQNIQNAIAPGVLIQLVQGVYYINAAIQMNQPCIIRGLGQGTIIQNEGTSNDLFQVNYQVVSYMPDAYLGQYQNVLAELSYLVFKQDPAVTQTAGFCVKLGTGTPIDFNSNTAWTRNFHLHHTMADGMWGGCNLINSAIHCHIRNNYWHNFTAGGAIDYNMGLGPGDIHIHDNEWFGTFSGIIIRQCDTFWCNNNKLNGSGIVFTGEGHASSVQFSNMSIETAGNVFPVPNQPPYMIDFGTGTSPTFIQFNGGETAWFPTLFGNPLNVNGFAFSLLNTIATSDYPAGLIMGGWNSVTFPPGAAPPETYLDFSDFAGAANTSLSSVSTTGGGTFASILSAGNDVQLPVLSGNSSAILTAGSASTTYGDTYGTFTPPSADYTVSADFVPQNSTNAMGIFIRVDPTNDNAYLFGSSNGAGFYLIKIVAGASTVVQTYALGWATGVKYTLGIGINGSAISCTLNGSVVITATDSAISAAGHGGFRITGGSSATVTNYGIS